MYAETKYREKEEIELETLRKNRKSTNVIMELEIGD
jgi:hypothetical protein